MLSLVHTARVRTPYSVPDTRKPDGMMSTDGILQRCGKDAYRVGTWKTGSCFFGEKSKVTTQFKKR